jgi:hypothetical protein
MIESKYAAWETPHCGDNRQDSRRLNKVLKRTVRPENNASRHDQLNFGPGG